MEVRARHREDGHLLPPKCFDSSRVNAQRVANLAKAKMTSIVQLSSFGRGFQPQMADIQDSGHRLNPFRIRDSDSGQSLVVTSPLKDGIANLSGMSKPVCMKSLWPATPIIPARMIPVSSCENSQMSSTGIQKGSQGGSQGWREEAPKFKKEWNM